MAVAFDAVQPGSSGKSGTSSPQTWTHTVSTGPAAIVVGIAVGHAVGSDTQTLTVTCDGTGMSLLGSVVNDNQGSSSAGKTYLYGIASQSAAGHSMSVGVSGGPTLDSIVTGSVSYSGADTSSPFGTAVTNFGSSGAPAVTVTGTTSGNMVAGVASIGSDTLTNPSTSRWIKNLNNNSSAGNAGQADHAAGGSITLTWSGDSPDWWGTVGVEVLAASSATFIAAQPLAVAQAVKRAAYY